MRGHETPENHPLTILKGFSTVSEEVFGTGGVARTLGEMLLRRSERSLRYKAIVDGRLFQVGGQMGNKNASNRNNEKCVKPENH